MSHYVVLRMIAACAAGGVDGTARTGMCVSLFEVCTEICSGRGRVNLIGSLAMYMAVEIECGLIPEAAEMIDE